MKWESVKNLMFIKSGREKFDLSKDEMVKQGKTSNFMFKSSLFLFFIDSTARKFSHIKFAHVLRRSDVRKRTLYSFLMFLYQYQLSIKFNFCTALYVWKAYEISLCYMIKVLLIFLETKYFYMTVSETSQSAITCSKLAIKTLKQGVKYVQR